MKPSLQKNGSEAVFLKRGHKHRVSKKKKNTHTYIYILILRVFFLDKYNNILNLWHPLYDDFSFIIKSRNRLIFCIGDDWTPNLLFENKNSFLLSRHVSITISGHIVISMLFVLN